MYIKFSKLAYTQHVMAMNKYFAEFIGTFVLVLIGCGSAVVAGSQISS